MSLAVALILLFLPVLGVILGGGLGWMLAAGVLAGQTGLALPRIMRLIWENLLEMLPAESMEKIDLAAVPPAANEWVAALFTADDWWLVNWLQARLMRQPLPPGQYPVTLLFHGLLRVLALIWVTWVAYVLVQVWLG